ncbi:MAG: TlpA family protein disulfide reductase [Chromatiales bacterium]|jgi:thiol-disulfide isomerase/thioredoxin|nr:TlpA family protein disulfide reductase [Chromatiales bacterium]
MKRLAPLSLTLALLTSIPLSASSAQEPLPFVKGSQTAIVSAHAGSPFVLALWSLDCLYCRHDLAMLGRLKAEHPQLQVVLVATDTSARRAEIAPRLDALALGMEESWIFADAFAERLNHEIDPQWFGELPRTYFYGRDGGRISVSGSLDEAAIEDWIKETYGEAHEEEQDASGNSGKNH